ncbi:MAG: prephenate dehydratase [Pirellulales bacterium]|nr:prephenate dehydratase [Pirellulales bacterium]
MARAKLKKRPPEKKQGASRPASPATLEAQLQRLDDSLVALLNQRAELARQVGEGKRSEGTPVFVPGQEEETLARVAALEKGPLPPNCVRAIFRELISGSRALLRQVRIAFLGPLYSFSHLAAIHRFGQSVEFVPVGTIAAVFEEVNRSQSDYGLVPIENSTDGRVADTLDMFTRLPVRICGEVDLEIHHTLLGKCARNEVREVYSKPQALSQCRNWLARHLPAARMIEVTSTSTAAQLASEKPGAAAIASIQAGVHYGLSVLAEQIEDNPSNKTRFAVIGDHSAPRTGNDKTAMLFQVEHRPGALADAMNIFKRNRLNLTWIESFPIPGSSRTYLFFVEMEGHETDTRVRRAVASLERKTLRLEILGSFAAGPNAG